MIIILKPKDYQIIIDIYRGILNPQDIKFVTEDNNNCVMRFALKENKITPYDLTGCLVRLLADGQQQDCEIVSAVDGTAKITLRQSMFALSKKYTAELQIYDVTNQINRLTTPTFVYSVRKSLMDDSTVESDPNYSILQNMIINVSNASEVATEALSVANNALSVANQAESKAQSIMANGDYAKAQGDYAKAEGAKVANRITLDSVPGTNFNFITRDTINIDTINIDGNNLSFKDKEINSFFKIGKNLFAGEWVLGNISSTNGSDTVSSSSYRNNTFLETSNNTRYTIGITSLYKLATLYLYEYTKEKIFISRTVLGEKDIYTFTTSGNTGFVRFSRYYSNGSADILKPITTQLVLGDTLWQYEPYGKVLQFKFMNNEDISLIRNMSTFYNSNIDGVAHRGYSFYAPENTLPAYELAFKNGFKFVEADFQITKDGRYVLQHDITIDRNSNGTGSVSQYTLEELRQFDFGSWKSDKYIGTRIATLEEFLLLCKKLNLKIYLECKVQNGITDLQAEELVRIAKKYGMLTNISWIGNFINYCDKIRVYYPKARIGGLLGNGEVLNIEPYKSRSVGFDTVFVDSDYRNINDNINNLCSNNDIPLEVYTTDSVDEVINLCNYNIKKITTNLLNISKVMIDDVFKQNY